MTLLLTYPDPDPDVRSWRNRCRMYGCTRSCSGICYVYTVRSSRRSVARPMT